MSVPVHPSCPAPPSLKHFAQAHGLLVPAPMQGTQAGVLAPSLSLHAGSRLSLPRAACRHSLLTLGILLWLAPWASVSIVLWISFLAQGITFPSPRGRNSSSHGFLAASPVLSPFLASVPSVRLQTFRAHVSQAASSCPAWVPSSLSACSPSS